MPTLLGSLKNRFNNILAHDLFVWLDHERSDHLMFNQRLERDYTAPVSLVKVGTYWLPENFKQVLCDRPYIISGGVEFHIEFESAISELLPSVKIDLFDVDIRSIKWFQESFAGNTRLQIHHLGLSDSIHSMSVYGSARRGWSSSVDHSHIVNSPLSWEKVCEANLITVGKHLTDSGLSPDAIGILKLDIEGMADRVIKNTLCSGIFPRIILFEMERAQKIPFTVFQERVLELLSIAQEAQYSVQFIPRSDKYTSFSSEFLLISQRG